MIPKFKFLNKEELEDGAYYIGRCRNARIARWCAAENQFYHWRVKFGNIFIETIKHPADEQQFDVFYPQQKTVDTKFEIPLDRKTPFKGNEEDLRNV